MTQRYEAGEKFVRVMQLLRRLSDTRAGLTTQQLADELEVNKRSVQRYLATLRDSAGMDIVEREGRWLIGSQSRLPPMQLDRYQATSLLLAVRALLQMRSDQDVAVVGALAQLAQTLRIPVVTRYLEALISAAERRPTAPGRRDLERVLVDGFVLGRVVEVVYRDAAGRESQRSLRPYFLEPRPESRTIYVFAHDGATGEIRTFRIDRIVSARLTTIPFDPPRDFDIDAAVGESWGIWQTSGSEEVVLRFDASMADRVREALVHRRAQITPLPGGDLEVRIVVSSAVEMRPWVLGWGGSVEVLAPESLRQHIAATVTEAARRYARRGAGSERRRTVGSRSTTTSG